jgi:hypothetical protein
VLKLLKSDYIIRAGTNMIIKALEMLGGDKFQDLVDTFINAFKRVPPKREQEFYEEI